MAPRTAIATLVLLAALAGCEAPPAPPVVPSTDVKAVDTPPPVYPMELACDGIGGKVTLMVTVGPEGTVTGASMRQSSGQPALDAAAQEAVRDWRFRAATRNGQPVSTEIQVPITFNVPPQEPEDCYFLRTGQAPPAA